MTQNILPFHKQDMETLALLRRKRTEARVGFFVFFLVGLAVGVVWADTRNRMEMDAMQRAYVRQFE